VEKSFLLGEILAGVVKLNGDLFGNSEEGLQFIVNDGFQINDGDFIEAFTAYIFRRVVLQP